MTLARASGNKTVRGGVRIADVSCESAAAGSQKPLLQWEGGKVQWEGGKVPGWPLVWPLRPLGWPLAYSFYDQNC